MAEPAVVHVDGVSKRFTRRRRLGRALGQRTTALDAVGLHADPGELVAVTGPNAAGKSTLLRILATLVTPDEGRVEVGGVDAAVDPLAVRRQVAFVPADDRAFSLRLSGWDNLEFHGRLHHRDLATARAAVGRSLDHVGLADVASQPVAGYSSGMRQRLALARALASGASVLLLDEPFRSLDDDATDHIAAVLTGLALAEGRTVIAATHQLAPLAWSQVVRLVDGRVVDDAEEPSVVRS